MAGSLEELEEEFAELNEHDDEVSSHYRLDTAITLAQTLSHAGASSIRTGDILRLFLSRVGFEEVSVKVYLTSVAITVKNKEGECLTRTAVMDHGVNFNLMVGVHELVRELKPGMATTHLRRKLDGTATDDYNKITTASMIAISCSCICLMIGGDLKSVPIVFISTFIGMEIRQFGLQYLNIYLVWFLTAYVSATVSLLISTFLITTETPQKAMLSPTLMLIPGVPIVSSVMELVRKNSDAGIARLSFLALLILVHGEGLLFAALQFGLLQTAEFFRGATCADFDRPLASVGAFPRRLSLVMSRCFGIRSLVQASIPLASLRRHGRMDWPWLEDSPHEICSDLHRDCVVYFDDVHGDGGSSR
jgi:uncharacterized membrane protein YjjP (DUF1212 family)